ncbi:MAG: hypothetical protein RLN75_02870 [Longimicrobiales bacterium]
MRRPNMVAHAVVMVAIVGFVPGAASSQILDGDEVQASIIVDSVFATADSVFVHFRVAADSASPSSLLAVYLDTPAGGIVGAPTGDELDWFTSPTWNGEQRSVWGALELIGPGDVSGPLSLRAAGFPGVVDAWLRGDYTILSMPESDSVPSPLYPDLWTDGSVQGKTVGGVPTPVDTSAGALLDRLATLASDACGTLGWITDSTTCTSIATDIGDADTAEAASDPTTADAELDAVLSTLSTALGNSHASTQGYWLLRSNIEIIQGKL